MNTMVPMDGVLLARSNESHLVKLGTGQPGP